jgi:hypothetical protein
MIALPERLTSASIVIGDTAWQLPALLLGIAGVLLTLWWNRNRLTRLASGPWFRIAGWLLLVACLVNPLWSSARPRRGANVLAVIADNSRSHLVSAEGDQQTRADQISAALETGEEQEGNGWLSQLGQDFELRRYTAGERLRQVRRYGKLDFDGSASSLNTALQQIAERYEGQPLAGIVLLTDGNATDITGVAPDFSQLPPVHTVLPADSSDLPDLSVEKVTATQSTFDDAPVSIQVQTSVTGATGKQIQYTLLDQDGVSVETQTRSQSDDTPLKFEVRPTQAGTVFYTVRTALLESDGTPVSEEATDVNNERLIAVDRGSEPRRILYVSGRPNWDFKFLRRAIETDPLIELVALIRIAKKEARFDFRGRDGERSNSIFRGFEQQEQRSSRNTTNPFWCGLGQRMKTNLCLAFRKSPSSCFSMTQSFWTTSRPTSFWLTSKSCCTTSLHDVVVGS